MTESPAARRGSLASRILGTRTPTGYREQVFVLGIDPGLTRCGYGAVEATPGRAAQARAGGVLATSVESSVPERLAALARDLRCLMSELRPDVVVIERVVFQTAVRNAIPVAQAAGVAMCTAIESGSEVVEYAANEVKVSVTGTGSAPKEQVQKMVQSLLRLPAVPSPPDVADALALALCHLARAPLSQLTGSKT